MKRIIYLGLAVLVVLLLWSGAWLYFAGEIKKNVEVLATADGISSPKITCGSLSVGGFPFHFNADCVDGTLVQADTTVTLADLRVSALAYQPTHILVSAKSPVTVSDAFTGAANRLDWESMEGSIRLDNWQLGRISLIGKKLTFNDTVLGENLIASADDVEVHLLDIPEQHEAEKGLAAIAVYGKTSNLAAPGFAIAAGESSIEAEINGLPDDVRLLGEPDALPRWQQSGGRIKLIAAKGSDGDRFFDSAGTLGLDEQAHAEGQIKLTSRGLVELFQDQIPEAVRGIVLGPKGVDGSYAQTFNIRAGVIVAGIIPLGMIPPLY